MTKRAALVKVRARSRSSLGAPTPPLRHSCAGRNPHPHIPFPNSSLPPSRGEVRWGVEAPSHRHQPCAPRSPISLLLRRIPRPPTSFLRPPPSFLRRQEPRPSHTRTSPSPIHPSPLPGGRLGGGWKPPSHRHQPCAPRSPIPLPPRHSCAPLRHSCAGRNPRPPPVIPAPLPSVIPAQAGTRPPTRHSCTPPLRHSCAGRNDEGGVAR